jgi:hypothetical protein
VTRRPALIVFCREPAPGRAKTRLIGALTPEGAAAFADRFIRDALAKARAVRPGRLVIAANTAGNARASRYFLRLGRRFGAEVVDQGRGDLGRRMARALAPYADGGALLIGTDTPTLPRRALARLLELLATASVVIGPSLDGGYYAIGVRGTLPPVFAGPRWGGPGVLADTLKRLRRGGWAYALGPAWYDVDENGDLAVLIEHLRRFELRGRLRRTRRALDAHPCPATAALVRKLGLLGSGG